ncbi:transcriptional regulator [Novosphingobium guangzhouense]|uniref:Transcriptional regulator n=2 Tax=Novosphingobium guangzhouense TaxID=1850347 RepID=A0A2K2G4K5_9SPHN|nr:transcriptional regulator [Novosphingobium guangzhouense]
MQAGRLDPTEWERLLSIRSDVRRFILLIGSATAGERAELLQAGFGEVVHSTIEPGEFEARACRLAQLTRWLPRHRKLGGLELDLLAREAYGHGKSLNLNPREFALIWRLADTPGKPVSKQDLIQDVWRMGFVPETNSIAVHMSRLRRKLSFVGMAGIIETAAAGGYCLLSPDEYDPQKTFSADMVALSAPQHAAA